MMRCEQKQSVIDPAMAT